MKKLFLALVLCLPFVLSSAQEESFFPRELTVVDTATLEAISLYHEDDRMAILEICKHPTFLISLDAGQKKYDDLQNISILGDRVRTGFKDLIADYPEETQLAAKRIVELPEVVSLLVDNLNLTVMLGESYKNHPEKILEEAEQYSLIVTRRNAEELADYQEQLKEDPEAYEEMLAAADQYAEDNHVDNYDVEQSENVQV